MPNNAMNSLISIIIRTKNEERWITQCLKSVFTQTYKNMEVIVVDNESTDQTLSLVKKFPVKKIVSCKEYLPGKALNAGIRVSGGKYIALLSGHCIPVNHLWLENLVKNFDQENVAGVYGRQEPLAMTSDADKRDLLTIFGLDRKVQKKDSFFHNANSMIRRDLWDKRPFDEQITNIEDRLWAFQMQQDSYTIVYEPEASVFHHHGIHHNEDKQRCYNVVRIVEGLLSKKDGKPWDPAKTEVIAIIPVRGKTLMLGGKSLLQRTVEQAKESKYLKKIIVLTDDQETADLAKQYGAEVPFLRDESLSQDYVDIEKVYSYSLTKIEAAGIKPDIIAALEITFPFRKQGFIDQMVERFLSGNFDSMLAVRKEHRSIWKKDQDSFLRVDDGLAPRKYKDPVYLGLRGLCCLTRPILLQQGSFFGENVGLFEIDDPLAEIEVREEKDVVIAEALLNAYKRISS